MSVLATLPPTVQLTMQPSGVIIRVHLDLSTGQPNGYEVVASVDRFVAAGAQERCPAMAGWRRFLVPEGLAYVHPNSVKVEELAVSL